jgi:hypothetical protein
MTRRKDQDGEVAAIFLSVGLLLLLFSTAVAALAIYTTLETAPTTSTTLPMNFTDATTTTTTTSTSTTTHPTTTTRATTTTTTTLPECGKLLQAPCANGCNQNTGVWLGVGADGICHLKVHGENVPGTWSGDPCGFGPGEIIHEIRK